VPVLSRTERLSASLVGRMELAPPVQSFPQCASFGAKGLQAKYERQDACPSKKKRRAAFFT
jgi:hypothetical protein